MFVPVLLSSDCQRCEEPPSVRGETCSPRFASAAVALKSEGRDQAGFLWGFLRARMWMRKSRLGQSAEFSAELQLLSSVFRLDNEIQTTASNCHLYLLGLFNTFHPNRLVN